MSQLSFSDAEYAGKRKKTRREVFLGEMDQVVPWRSLLGLIEPFYPVAGRGRHPYPLDTMLRIHLMQNWFGLSDPAMEEALYEITPMRAFAGLSINGPIPDETTIRSEPERQPGCPIPVLDRQCGSHQRDVRGPVGRHWLRLRDRHRQPEFCFSNTVTSRANLVDLTQPIRG